MKITIEIVTDNAAFEDDMERELDDVAIRAIAEAGTMLRKGGKRALLDSNGNTCGSVTVTES